jgi:hypothetical protein
MSLLLTDPSVLAFYAEHPTLDVNVINRVFVQVLRQLSTNLTDTLVDTRQQQVLDRLREVETEMRRFHTEQLSASLNDTLADTMQQQVLDRLRDVEAEMRRFHTEGLRDRLETHSLVQQDRFRSTLSAWQGPTETWVPVLHSLQTTEDRVTHQVSQLKQQVEEQVRSQQVLDTHLHAFLHKYEHQSAAKGWASEVQLSDLLQEVFPSDEWVHCGAEPGTCDFRVNRRDPLLSSLLFENKDYTRPVSKDEVAKFQRDVAAQKTHGILLSQRSAITYKDAFQIDVLGGLIHVYVPNVGYDRQVVRCAVRLVDALVCHLPRDTETDETESASWRLTEAEGAQLVRMHDEWGKQKAAIGELVRAQHKALLEQLELCHVGPLRQLLLAKGRLQPEDSLRCGFCRVYVGKTKAGLAQHARGCKSNPDSKKRAGSPSSG